MRFCDLLDAVRRQPLELSIPAGWAQGRASFGGLVVALQYEAMRAKVPADRPVRSLAITFVGPVEPDVPVSFEVEVLREGKAVSQVLGRAMQGGQVVTLVQGSFGASRPSEVAVQAVSAPAMKHWDDCQELPFIEGVLPQFMQHLAMRWSVGGLPFTGNTSRQMGGWVRLRGDVKEEPVTEAHILALVDAWPPALMPFLKKPAMGHRIRPAVAGAEHPGLVQVPGRNRACRRRLRPCRREVVGRGRAVDRHEPANGDGVRLINDDGGAPSRRATSRR
jgi:acyl-CoA thioesterase